MALRDQPYLPLYIQDFLTDEKLNECSASATGVYIKVMCLLHKSDPYGKLLLKQKDKQNGDQISDFASKIANLLPYNVAVVLPALQELLTEEVLKIEGDYLVQKRMVRDGEISLTRSKSGKKGGEETQKKNKTFALANNEAKAEANSEYENVIKYLELESIRNEEAKTLAMVVVEMMTIWMDRKPDYKVYKELDYHACLRIAYLIAGVKGFRFADVTGQKESEVLKSWEKIALFIANHTFYTTLTLDAIGNDKMFQKIETSMREAKNNHGGNGMPADVTLAEARKNFKSQLPKE